MWQTLAKGILYLIKRIEIYKILPLNLVYII